jgi:hypothetical protein
MVIDEGRIQQKQKPVACKEENTAEGPMYSKFRKNEFVDARRGIKWVDVIEFKVRQAHQLINKDSKKRSHSKETEDPE